MDKKTAVHKIEHNTERTIRTLTFLIFAVLCGLLIGATGVLFHECIDFVTELRMEHPRILLLLPFGAVLILFLYRRTGNGAEGGTNLIISSIQSGETVPLRMAPLIFIATTISHLAGASVGREGAALQLGGSIGHYIASASNFSDRGRKTLVMTGMSAAFSAMFGTPLAAAVFPMEVVSVGIMHYSALLPCTIASFVAYGVSVSMGGSSPFYELGKIPAFDIRSCLFVLILALLSGFLSWIFCETAMYVLWSSAGFCSYTPGFPGDRSTTEQAAATLPPLLPARERKQRFCLRWSSRSCPFAPVIREVRSSRPSLSALPSEGSSVL